ASRLIDNPEGCCMALEDAVSLCLEDAVWIVRAGDFGALVDQNGLLADPSHWCLYLGRAGGVATPFHARQLPRIRAAGTNSTGPGLRVRVRTRESSAHGGLWHKTRLTRNQGIKPGVPENAPSQRCKREPTYACTFEAHRQRGFSVRLRYSRTLSEDLAK